ncbi:MAG: DotU family type IV/VI secretion system protein [Desulfatitalea sp.]|nr:DotU family type IV/VI secretion system protein [Desulfatitalea sp.]NNK02411.1 DotU family type IV/VI secretion system protein [Desulfatitalea sp.]
MTRLIDCFMELIVYVVHTVRHIQANQPDLDAVKSDIDLLLEKSDKCRLAAHISEEDYDYARLSICVWIDEAIMNSEWVHTIEWRTQKLQRRYYNITDGGQEFFDRLDKLGHEDRDVREVAYFCLTLGLAGRFVEKGDGVILDHLKATNLKRLFGSSAGEPTLENRQLFPEAYQRQGATPPVREKTVVFRLIPVVLGLIPVGLFFVLLVVYHYLLETDLKTFSQM